MPAPRVSAVILAAGPNGRFERAHSKLLAEWRGRTLLEHVLAAAGNARVAGVVSEVVLVVPADAPRLKSLGVADGCRVAHPPPDRPISASLRVAVATVDPRVEGMVVLLGDQPRVTHAAIAAVVAKAGPSPQALVRARYHGHADPVSHPAYIGRHHFALVHRLEGESGFHAGTEHLGLRWKEVWLEGDNPDVDHVIDLGRLGTETGP